MVRTFHMQTNDPSTVIYIDPVRGTVSRGELDEHGNPTMAFCRGTGPRRNTLPKGGGRWCEDCQKIWMGFGGKSKGRKRRDERVSHHSA